MIGKWFAQFTLDILVLFESTGFLFVCFACFVLFSSVTYLPSGSFLLEVMICSCDWLYAASNA